MKRSIFTATSSPSSSTPYLTLAFIYIITHAKLVCSYGVGLETNKISK
jgi:hypothetical protein